MKFFELIPPGTKFPFVRSARYFIIVSIMLMLGSVAAMVFNYNTRGQVLNFGIDFAGGSAIRVALDKEIPIQDIREAIESAGYEGVSAVTVPDAQNQVLIHVKDVASIDKAQGDVTPLKIVGIDRQLVGQFASAMRVKRRPEPYNGKGIKYKEEVIKKKQGKQFGA